MRGLDSRFSYANDLLRGKGQTVLLFPFLGLSLELKNDRSLISAL